MAAVLEASPGITPQEILREVRNFLDGVNSQVHNLSQSESLAHSALVLLRTLPTARHAVLEYLANLFDEAVNNYLLELHIGHKVTDSGSSVTDSLLHDACGVLHTFIHTHSAAWAPIISSWSLELLGQISSKYSDRRGMPHTGSLNELLQLWMTCKPTKLLIEVATECFAQMVEGAPETCVDALLEASVKYSPHFDWVVAHIGSCFPTSIITRVLMCGLKDYCNHGSRGDVAMDEKVPKMGSVVGILGHLASKHSQDIRVAFMKLFQDSLEGATNVPHVTTLPFLLQLASMSPMLLHIMATDIVNALTAPVLNKLHVQFLPWIQSNPHEFESMMTLVIHLVMQSDTGADKSLDFLIYNATVTKEDVEEGTSLPLPEIQKTCAVLIDQILSETQTFLIRRSRNDTSLHVDIPYLSALSSRLPQLTRDMLHSEHRKSKWLQKLICYIILYEGEKQGAETLARIVAQAENTQQLSNFQYVQQNIEVMMPRVLPVTSQKLIDLLEPHTDTDKLRLVKNLYQIMEWERTSGGAVIRSQFRECLQPHWQNLSSLLLHSDLEVAMVVVNILNYVPIPTALSSGAVVHVCGALVALFFRVLELEDRDTSNQVVHACCKCARMLARREYAQRILVQCLLEGAISKENKSLLGGKIDIETSRVGTHDSHTSLLHENKKHGLSLTIQRSHSSVFHAGVIGEGLRRGEKQHVYLQAVVNRNHHYLLEMLWKCCQDNQSIPQTPMEGEEHQGASKNYSLKVSADLSRMIGSLIVELATPDVLYNNRFWPEEESLKMTVERDLLVWKMFDNNPVLWEVMAMLASNSLIMSRCSVVLKSLTATLMHHFESSREKTAQNSPKQLECACHVVRCLAKSCLLPAPLSYLPELLPLVTPYEVYLMLLTVWRYMKETPPTEDPEEVSRRVCGPRHTEVVRAIIHKNIETAGFLYARFFNTSPTTVTDTNTESQPVIDLS